MRKRIAIVLGCLTSAAGLADAALVIRRRLEGRFGDELLEVTGLQAVSFVLALGLAAVCAAVLFVRYAPIGERNRPEDLGPPPKSHWARPRIKLVGWASLLLAACCAVPSSYGLSFGAPSKAERGHGYELVSGRGEIVRPVSRERAAEIAFWVSFTGPAVALVAGGLVLVDQETYTPSRPSRSPCDKPQESSGT